MEKGHGAGMSVAWTKLMTRAIGYHHSFIKLACPGIRVALRKEKALSFGQREQKQKRESERGVG